MIVLVRLIVMVGMLAVVPLGLGLVGDPRLEWMRRRWWAAALPGAVSLWLPRGGPATVSACCYGAGTVVLAAQAPLRLVRRRALAPGEIAVMTALVAPVIAAVALVAERSGHRLFGLSLTVLALTVPHFHFAGFSAALVAGLVCRASGDGPAGRAAALSVPAGTALVLLGYFTGEWTQAAGAMVLTCGMWLVGWITWRELRPVAPDRVTGLLLGVSACVLAATMLLALDWAVGRAAGFPHLTLSWMVATHGVGNALGFALCAVLAWRRLGAARAMAAQRIHDRTEATA